MSLLIAAAALAIATVQDPATDVSPVIIKPTAPPPAETKPTWTRPVRVRPGKVGITDFDRISCRRIVPLGQRRPIKVCDTSLGWKRREDQAEMMMDPGRRTPGTKADFAQTGGP
ncbi:MAG TPA: hypothetical protein VEA44_16675 [Caulobacter sp.]|nr:hypothetical protein [Caulobacter sp.]